MPFQVLKLQGLEIKKTSGRHFATSYENLVTTFKILVAKLIAAIELINTHSK